MCTGAEIPAAYAAIAEAFAGMGAAEGAAAGVGAAAAGAGAAGAGAGATAGMTAAEIAAAMQGLAEGEAVGSVLAGEAGGLLSGKAAAIGAEAGLMGPQNMSMETALMDTGYTPSSLGNAAKFGPGSGQSFEQTMGNWAGNKGTTLMQTAQNNPMGLLSGGGGGGSDMQKMMMANMGMGMMQPKPAQPPPPAPPMQGQQGPLQSPYGGQGQQGPYSRGGGIDPSTLTEEQKRMLRMKGVRI